MTGLTSVLLIEDDAGDALLVQEYLDDLTQPLALTWCKSLADAAPVLRGGVHCVLLDLGLPDSHGLSGVAQVRALAPDAAVLVLTGDTNADRGLEAVAAGCQDYLTKNEVDGPMLGRSIRYAIERKRAERSEQRLREAEIHRAEYARMERGLLPVPILSDPRLFHALRYRPGRHQALLGGDFYDVIELDDGTLHILIGDVCGHGPDEAALGVSLRIAWRTLVLADYDPDRLLGCLQAILVRERQSAEVFATVATASIVLATGEATLRLGGHPAPIRRGPSFGLVQDERAGLPLGVLDALTWPGTPVSLGPEWSLVFYTDGLIEGRGSSGEELGSAGLVALVARFAAAAGPQIDPERLADELVEEVERLNGEALNDDVAVLVIGRGP